MRIITLHDEAGGDPTGVGLPRALAELYDGDLRFPPAGDRPFVFGNFVQTIDGIVSYQIPGRASGTAISGGSAADRFIMGLLRSAADAVLFGSGTLHGDPGHVRTPEGGYPDARDLYASFREELGKPPLPINVVLTASGRIDAREPTFHTDGLRAVIITTDEGAARLEREHGGALASTVVRSTGESGATSPGAVLKILADEFGVRMLLHEGGPIIFGEYLAAGAVDELFLTVAPRVAGRGETEPRPGFAGPTSFMPDTAPRFSLRSVRKSADDLLFLRYVADREAVGASVGETV